MITLGCIFIGIGLLFFLGTTIGLLRFPDFYSRMHAAGKGDTLSTVLILLGCICLVSTQGGMSWLLGLKILLIINFIFIGSPTATHAMMDAGNKAGAKPWKKESK
ncbi:MAG: monovalent cation/H(+) antiporter subunit G [Verrucomicrobiota bacterium]|jgi:multicomponent Na+:H+ antiporter subunit G|nr:monovalent cation/H(+) antiporter subunit G [Verrucomicrobiota bacterium]